VIKHTGLTCEVLKIKPWIDWLPHFELWAFAAAKPTPCNLQGGPPVQRLVKLATLCASRLMSSSYSRGIHRGWDISSVLSGCAVDSQISNVLETL